MPSEWTAGKAEIVGILQSVARERGTITYSDLSRQLLSITIPHDDPAMAVMLDEISTGEFRAGRGMLWSSLFTKPATRYQGQVSLSLPSLWGVGLLIRKPFGLPS